MARKTATRELVQPRRGDKRYVRRTKEGRFTTSQDDVGKSLGQDRCRKAKDRRKKRAGRSRRQEAEKDNVLTHP